jgi:hypothetical protein
MLFHRKTATGLPSKKQNTNYAPFIFTRFGECHHHWRRCRRPVAHRHHRGSVGPLTVEPIKRRLEQATPVDNPPFTLAVTLTADQNKLQN